MTKGIIKIGHQTQNYQSSINLITINIQHSILRNRNSEDLKIEDTIKIRELVQVSKSPMIQPAEKMNKNRENHISRITWVWSRIT
jgi:hypothetical protein